MATAKITIEGTSSISLNTFICICAKCNNHDRENATIEINFREQKVFYLCGQCKHMNEMFFGQQSAPLPRIKTGRIK